MPHVQDVIDKICLHFPETEKVISHGSPEYKVRGKSFASFSINHHGDLRVALILNASRETQTMYVESAPKVFFVPPYVGPKGWYGIDLASKVRWERVAELTRDAYVRVAPKTLGEQAVPLKKVPEPDTVDVKKLDPLFAPRNQKRLDSIRKICLALPEASEDATFGSPVFRVGKKTFVQFTTWKGIPCAHFWVGPARQVALTADKRFDIPPYMGHNGWIRLAIDKRFDTEEIEALALESYRHFALKRMLKALDD
jgi:predicted DNA-binding protein (MmcQ/YjbR family)